MSKTTESWYNQIYSNFGIKAQRRYPNEELARFVGVHISKRPLQERSSLKCLEVGCGSGGNLWMLAEYGCQVIGLDISIESIKVAQSVLEARNLNAELIHASMTDMNMISKNSIDYIFDIFSSNCLNLVSHAQYISEATRILKPGGKIFIFTPSKRSDAFLNHLPSTLIDESTLAGIRRTDSPFFGNFYDFRFEHPIEFSKRLTRSGLTLVSVETTSRSYNNMQENFEFISICCQLVN